MSDFTCQLGLDSMASVVQLKRYAEQCLDSVRSHQVLFVEAALIYALKHLGKKDKKKDATVMKQIIQDNMTSLLKSEYGAKSAHIEPRLLEHAQKQL